MRGSRRAQGLRLEADEEDNEKAEEKRKILLSPLFISFPLPFSNGFEV